MAKYIDLLRKHQNKGVRGDNPLAETASETQKTETVPQHDELETMLTDEPERAPETVRSHAPKHELLAEEREKELDDYSSTAPAAGTEFPPQPVTASNISTWLDRCFEKIATLFKEAASDEAGDIQPLIEQLNIFIEKLQKDQTVVDTLELEVSNREKKICEFDVDLGGIIQKSVMMMLYAIKIGKHLKLCTDDELRSHILAAMLHHIGMTQVSPEIRNKKDLLTEDEIQQIREAPKKSYAYLNKIGITDAAILQAANQAQERYDGSGPQELTGSNIAYSARIVGLLSMFEALIHYRPYRDRLLPRDAIRELVNHHKKAFDPKILKALIESISLYPVGTYVQLNSSDIGLVIQVHPRLPLRPKIRIMFDSSGDTIPPREIDLQAQPNLIVQRCMYEEALAKLKGPID